jgi:hypothetical protein
MFEIHNFCNYECISKRSIYVGNNSIQETIRKKNVSLTMKMGKSEVKGVLHEVLYVSDAPLS